MPASAGTDRLPTVLNGVLMNLIAWYRQQVLPSGHVRDRQLHSR
jgi:hypothetical protein